MISKYKMGELPDLWKDSDPKCSAGIFLSQIDRYLRKEAPRFFGFIPTSKLCTRPKSSFLDLRKKTSKTHTEYSEAIIFLLAPVILDAWLEK